MASKTYDATIIVLRKTKLGESDLILSLMAEDGHQVRAVAKGARKPTSSFASRLELFSVAEVLLVSGRSLDIVKEAKLRASNDRLRQDMHKTAAASLVSELLLKSTQVGLESPRLFPMTAALFERMGEVEDPDRVTLLAVAGFLKLIAVQGFRPYLSDCVECGASLEDGPTGERHFSARAGGALCPRCRSLYPTLAYAPSVLSWVEALIQGRYHEIAELAVDRATLQDLLVFCREWAFAHLGCRLRSLDYLEKELDFEASPPFS